MDRDNSLLTYFHHMGNFIVIALITTPQSCIHNSYHHSLHSIQMYTEFKELRPKEAGHHFTDNIFKCFFLNENLWISINISLKFVLEGQSNNIPSLIQIMACADQATSHYLNQWWLRLVTHIYTSLGLNELRQGYHVFNVILNFSLGNVKHICIFHHFSTLKWHRLFRPFPLEINNPFILHIQYHGCWYPDETRSQEISCHGIDLIIPEYYSFSTTKG